MSAQRVLSSVTRPACAEAAGQLRGFCELMQEGENVDSATFGLFASRTRQLLAGEADLSGKYTNNV